MKNKIMNRITIALAGMMILQPFFSPVFAQELTENQKLLQVMHSIDSMTLYRYVEELASEKYAGRLTGTPGYNTSAEWVSRHFEDWGLTHSALVL
jgi:hypothetical protein